MILNSPALSALPGRGNQTTLRKPTTFDRAFTNSFTHGFKVRMKPTTSEVKDIYFDD